MNYLIKTTSELKINIEKAKKERKKEFSEKEMEKILSNNQYKK